MKDEGLELQEILRRQSQEAKKERKKTKDWKNERYFRTCRVLRWERWVRKLSRFLVEHTEVRRRRETGGRKK